MFGAKKVATQDSYGNNECRIYEWWGEVTAVEEICGTTLHKNMNRRIENLSRRITLSYKGDEGKRQYIIPPSKQPLVVHTVFALNQGCCWYKHPLYVYRTIKCAFSEHCCDPEYTYAWPSRKQKIFLPAGGIHVIGMNDGYKYYSNFPEGTLIRIRAVVEYVDISYIPSYNASLCNIDSNDMYDRNGVVEPKGANVND